MILEKIKEYGVDLSFTLKDVMRNMYVAEPFKYHSDYNSFQLIFKFEDWTGIIGDGKGHMNIVAEYGNANNRFLVKFQDEDFDRLLKKVSKWNEEHRVYKMI